jgi:hypothetical protein
MKNEATAETLRTARSSISGLVFLTLDERLRKNAKLLGFGLLPAVRRGFRA